MPWPRVSGLGQEQLLNCGSDSAGKGLAAWKQGGEHHGMEGPEIQVEVDVGGGAF